MQLQPRPSTGPPSDLGAGLADRAATLGQRPAVTVLGADGRAEQGFVTLAQWAAKGAHLLLADAFLTPGDRVLVDLPASWPLAAVSAAVWWTGGTVVVAPGATDLVAAVVHADRPVPDVDLAFIVGDEVDGGVRGAAAAPTWAEEVQLFPDAPPPRAAAPDQVALADATSSVTHAELVAALTGPDEVGGTLGLDLASWSADPLRTATLVAARPLVTGCTTLVLAAGLDRTTADGDRVRRWA